MAKYYDIDNDVRINGKLTIYGDTSIPSSDLLVGGTITGNIAQITTINGTTANITNVNSTGTISGGTVKGNGATLIVNGTTANGGTVPISNGWAYTHENKVGSQGHIPTGGTATTFLRGDNTWVIPTDTNTWRPIETSPSTSDVNSISSSWAKTHSGTYGLGAHVPTGGTAITFLRGDGTWVTPTDTNNYLTGLSSTAGGNGTLTASRTGLTDLTIDLSHTHSQYVTNNTANQSVLTGFTMSGNSYVGTASTAGALVIRMTGGANAIQLAGDNATQLAGTGVYMNASGNAKFSGTVNANTIAVTSTSMVTNLNSEMVNGIKEKYIAKNQSIYELGGKGVYSAMSVVAQAVPNMTVLVNAGTAYTDSGMRFTFSNTSVSVVASHATYDRKDVVYIQGSSASANEGVIAIATGTPASTPAEPSIPSDAVKLAVILVLKNIGSIQNVHITDAREYKNTRYYNSNLTVTNADIRTVTSDVTTFNGRIEYTNFTKRITIPKGQTSSTWTHSMNVSTYAVFLSCNSPEPHVYWSNNTSTDITINLDDVCDTDVEVHVILIDCD